MGKTEVYEQLINKSIDNNEKKKLEKDLSFKQYPDKTNNSPISDLQKLIQENDKYGAYLWDPYLTAEDIFKTLYYSKTSNTPLKAIGSKKKGEIWKI